MKAILLAAGFATRLLPRTLNQAKALLDVGGRPVLSWVLERVLKLPDVREILVVTNGKFFHDFEAWQRDYSGAVPLRLLDDHTMDDAGKLGGVGDMAFAMDHLAGPGQWIDEDLLVVAGDNLMEFDLKPFAEAFQRLRTPLLLARQLDGPMPPRRHGEIHLDDHGRVTRFREKPEDPQTDLAGCCIYFFPPLVHGKIKEYLKEGNPDAPGHFIAWLVQQTPVHAVPFRGQLFDIGNAESLAAARACYTRAGDRGGS